MKKNTDFAQMKDFQELNEKELQEIRGGDKRGVMDLFRQIPIFRKK
ncbi:ComC/BlpC family leader-containing pheromone/bacteriocin [Streptococcus infantis]